MTEPITKEQLIDASADALTLEEVVNGSDTLDVTSRLARTYPSLAKALRLIVQNGLLGATAFNLKSSMLASALVNDDYAVVTDDPELDSNGFPANNGFYQKRDGVFEFLAWNPINQFLAALAAETSARVAGDATNATAIASESTTRTEQVSLINAALAKIFGAVRFNGYHDDFGNSYLFALVDNQRVGFGITTKLKVIWGNKQIIQDDVAGIKDRFGRYIVAITKNGKVYIPNLVFPAALTTALTSLGAQITAEIAARIAGDSANTSAINTNSANLSALSGNFAVSTGVHDDQGNHYLFALINRTSGKIAFGVTSKINLMLKNSKLKPSDQPLLVQTPSGLTAMVVTNSGKAYIPELVLGPRQLAQIPATPSGPLSMQPMVRAQINHVVGDSQSLGIGVATVSAISTTQPYSNLMFAGGPTKAVGDVGYNPASLVPLVESNSVESPTAGALNGFVRRIAAAGGVASDYVMLGTQAGVGGQRIAALTDEALYVRLRQHIIDAKAAADALGQSYAVSAIMWIQGEADISGSLWTRAIDYYQRYLFLMTKIRDDAISASDQPFLPYVFSYQTSAHMYYNKRYLGIAIAQWRASVERKDICLATPAYRLPHAADNLHLSAEGSWLLGEYIARAMYWTLIKGQKWRPLEPIDVTWTATHIDVRYHVPCKPIQLSTVICNAATNQGFDIWTNGSVYDSGATSNDDTLISNAISSVAVVADDTIRITFTGGVTIPTDAVLSYGRGRSGDSQTSGPVTGARGNVVDSHGIYDKATAPTGTVFDLSNVSVHFEHGCKDGFF